jgi:hypothetical protein
MANQHEIKTLQELLDSDLYQIFESETLLNPQYHMINDTWIDVDIMLAANESGDFGVSHGDFIDCWIEFMETLDLCDKTYSNIMKEIIAVQEYHTEQKTIDVLI